MKPKLGRLHFGKYAGELVVEVAEVDPQYLFWLLEQEWVKPPLRLILHTALNLESSVPPTSRPLQLIIGRVEEALTARGWTKSESQQMIRRLMEASSNGKQP